MYSHSQIETVLSMIPHFFFSPQITVHATKIHFFVSEIYLRLLTCISDHLYERTFFETLDGH